MSDEHKAAIAAGRVETAAVRRYLEALDSARQRSGRNQSTEALQAKRARLDSELVDAKPLRRLQLLQDRRNVDVALAEAAAAPSSTDVEAGFVEHAASYAARHGVEYATWREFGVPAQMLRQAGIPLRR